MNLARHASNTRLREGTEMATVKGDLLKDGQVILKHTDIDLSRTGQFPQTREEWVGSMDQPRSLVFDAGGTYEMQVQPKLTGRVQVTMIDEIEGNSCRATFIGERV